MKYLNALNKINGLGPQKMRTLLSFFETPENIWQASIVDLEKSGIGPAITQKIVSERPAINPDAEWERLAKENIRMITQNDPAYPRLLKEISPAPYIIYMKGKIDLNAAPMISIVGSRKYTSYGAQAATSFAKDLAAAGITVVSGMALGIDSIAHSGALLAGGKTVAVLGGSLDDKNIYPRNNFNLSRDIIVQGALLSDYPIETPAGIPGNFPARNRIIAGLSLGTLVVEAGEKSGTLITATLALEFNREVFAVPGSIFSPQSIGTHNLIRNGAKIVTGVKDILEELDLDEMQEKTAPIAKIPETKEEEIILKILSTDPLHIDNISFRSKLDTSAVSASLSMMEIKGWTKNIGGQNYILI
ncbi:MAG: DNA-processing protein DprA [Parcubacteria group bacterium]|jgi:DNA processing protein